MFTSRVSRTRKKTHLTTQSSVYYGLLRIVETLTVSEKMEELEYNYRLSSSQKCDSIRYNKSETYIMTKVRSIWRSTRKKKGEVDAYK